MERRIVGFRTDEAGDWIAELDCGHARHVRHEPPLSERPWVRSEAGRAARLGTTLACGRCARREPPEGLEEVRRTATFDAETTPAALRSRHTTKRGTWATIRVLSGRLRYRIHEPFDLEEVLEPGRDGVVLPEVPHEVEPLGDVAFHVVFQRRGSGEP